MFVELGLGFAFVVVDIPEFFKFVGLLVLDDVDGVAHVLTIVNYPFFVLFNVF